MNLKMPTNEELIDGNMHRVVMRKPKELSIQKFKTSICDPTKKDKYYNWYSPLIKDFLDEVSRQPRSRVFVNIYNQQIVRKLAYYIRHPNYYGNSYTNFSISMMFGVLMSMRSYVMRQRIHRGEMKPVWNKCNPSSAGYYPLPKPMTNPSMTAMGSEIYDIVYTDVLHYLSQCDRIDNL